MKKCQYLHWAQSKVVRNKSTADCARFAANYAAQDFK